MAKFGSLRLWSPFSHCLIGVICGLLSLTLGARIAAAAPLAERLAQFPNWQTQPSLEAPAGDLVYPDWFAGTWQVTTTLVDLAAPLAPDLITPGFRNNQAQLNQPVRFQVRFQTATGQGIVADRAFNGLNLARAYLGQAAVLAVKIDPKTPNRQITRLRDGGQLVSLATGRATETPGGDQFITSELWQQLFRHRPQVYFNQVETTTAYRRLPDARISADQITAIYLSPQDPDYFKAKNQPVALYRYRLQLTPAAGSANAQEQPS